MLLIKALFIEAIIDLSSLSDGCLFSITLLYNLRSRVLICFNHADASFMRAFLSLEFALTAIATVSRQP
jgi:hypothetical protein